MQYANNVIVSNKNNHLPAKYKIFCEYTTQPKGRGKLFEMLLPVSTKQYRWFAIVIQYFTERTSDFTAHKENKNKTTSFFKSKRVFMLLTFSKV